MILCSLIRFYKVALSPWIGNRCRYLPTCSAYAIEAIERYGQWTGSWIALRRLARCHPWGSHGHDPLIHQKDRS